MQFVIGGLKKTSLIDYPDKISTIVFTTGCNFRCGYCHNAGLVSGKSKNEVCSTDSFFDFLKKRVGKLDAVVISGGEATLQPDLIEFVKRIKDFGYLVKLDTNGYKPEIIYRLLENSLVDYIAMDIKAPLDKYAFITNVDIDVVKIKESINLIMSSYIDYEFRTTVLKKQLDYIDFNKIAKLIKGAKKYFLQKFVVQSEILDESLNKEETYTDEEFKRIKEMLQQFINVVEVR